MKRLAAALTTGALAISLGVGACTSHSAAQLDSVQSVYAAVKDAGVNCGPLKGDTQPGLETKESGDCDLNNNPDATMYVYIPTATAGENADLRKAFLDMLGIAGGFTIYDAQRFRWVINVGDRATAEKIADALGGTM